jgi:hypothetical protein
MVKKCSSLLEEELADYLIATQEKGFGLSAKMLKKLCLFLLPIKWPKNTYKMCRRRIMWSGSVWQLYET